MFRASNVAQVDVQRTSRGSTTRTISQTSEKTLSSAPSPCSLNTSRHSLSKTARALRRFFSALALAVAMLANASSRMPTIRCCSGRGGSESPHSGAFES